MSDLTEFLLARIAEDETDHRRQVEAEARRRVVEQCQESDIYGPGAAFLCRHIPALLALPYVDHPDYRQEWMP